MSQTISAKFCTMAVMLVKVSSFKVVWYESQQVLMKIRKLFLPSTLTSFIITDLLSFQLHAFFLSAFYWTFLTYNNEIMTPHSSQT